MTSDMGIMRDAISFDGQYREVVSGRTAQMRVSLAGWICASLRALVMLMVAWATPAAALDDWQFSAGAATDNITRGIDISAGQPSLFASAAWYPGSGVFAGASASSIRSLGSAQTGVEFVTDAGYVWRAGNDWSAQAMLADYRFTGVPFAYRIDYDELVLTAGWRDSVFASITVSPNTGGGPTPRLWAVSYDLVGRVPLSHGFSAMASVGYYDIAQETGSGYVYGNAGLTYQYRTLQFDVQYFTTRASAQMDMRMGAILVHRWVADMIWHF